MITTTRRLVATAAAAACLFGLGTGVASAQLPDLGSSGGVPTTSATDPVVLVDSFGGIGTGRLTKQIMSSPSVKQGDTIKFRVMVQYVAGSNTRVELIRDAVPAALQLVKVERPVDGMLGTSMQTIEANAYEQTTFNGVDYTTVSWKEGGFLGMFQDNPEITPGHPVFVDFTYKVPADMATGEHKHGAEARINTLINPEVKNGAGAQPFTVTEATSPFGS